MKLAIVHPAFGAWGGAENLVRWWIPALRARGHEVAVLTGWAAAEGIAILREAGARVEILRAMHGRQWQRLQLRGLFPRRLSMADHVVRLDRPAMARGARALARRLRAFDAVLVHNFPAPWWVDLARFVDARVPPVVWYCGEPSRDLYPGLFEGAGFSYTPSGDPLQEHDRGVGRRVDAIVCNSGYVRDRVAAIYERDDVGVLYPGIPTALVEKALAPVPAAGGLARGPGGVLDVLCVTRLVPAKNVDCLIEAVRRVPGVRLHVVGGGPEAARLRAMAGERVRFAGEVDDARLMGYYRAADVFAYLPVGEPFGLTLLEAGAAGLPSIASAHGGPAEIVLHGETGWLVAPASPEAVADVLARVLHENAAHGGAADPLSPLARMGNAARRRVVERFTMPRMVERLERLLQEARRMPG